MKTLINRGSVVSFCVVLALAIIVWQGVVTHERLTVLEKLVDVAWADTDNSYQYRADLVPQFVKAASATPNFDSSATATLLQAQAEVEKFRLDPKQVPTDSSRLNQYDQAQTVLTKSLFHVVAVPMIHHDVKVTTDFRNLTGRLINIQTNVAVARNRFIGAAQTYDQYVQGFPGVLYASAFGFKATAYFPPQAVAGNTVANATARN